MLEIIYLISNVNYHVIYVPYRSNDPTYTINEILEDNNFFFNKANHIIFLLGCYRDKTKVIKLITRDRHAQNKSLRFFPKCFLRN